MYNPLTRLVLTGRVEKGHYCAMLFANTDRRHRWYVQITRASSASTVNTGRVHWRLKLNPCSRAVLSGHEHGHVNASSVHRAEGQNRH